LALPGLIGERLFNLFDVDGDEYLAEEEFKRGMKRLFGQNIREYMKLVYDLFDFDLDGKVSKEDIRTLLSHVPLAEVLKIKEIKDEKSSDVR